jgi:hypothetical protein
MLTSIALGHDLVSDLSYAVCWVFIRVARQCVWGWPVKPFSWSESIWWNRADRTAKAQRLAVATKVIISGVVLIYAANNTLRAATLSQALAACVVVFVVAAGILCGEARC